MSPINAFICGPCIGGRHEDVWWQYAETEGCTNYLCRACGAEWTADTSDDEAVTP